jgi:hypothetical protein
MLQASLDWREKFGLSEFQEKWKDLVAIENSTGKTYCRGYDKHGHPIIYMKPCNENTKDHDAQIKHLIYNMEKAVACMKERKTDDDSAIAHDGKLVLVIDYNGYSLSNSPPMKTSREVLSILQDHYPERLFRAYCIRPPYIFYAFYSIISPFIDSVTKDKIRMLTNSDMNADTNKLYEEVDRSMLELCAGGSDARPFNSSVYLNGTFDHCYLTMINNASVEGKESSEGK